MADHPGRIINEPQIVRRGPILIAGAIISCRGVGFENNEALMRQSQRLLADSDKRIGKEDRYLIGFASVPKTDGTALMSCLDGLDHFMIAGYEVADLHRLPVGIVGMELPETLYAIFTHVGSPISLLEDTIKPALQWVATSNYRLNGPFDVEHEGKDFLDHGRNPDSRSYFWLPVIERVPRELEKSG